MTRLASRRKFLNQVGLGMFVASVGSGLAVDMGLADLRAAEGDTELSFGAREPLVDFLQSNPADKMLPHVVGLIKTGTPLQELVAAAALANARAFGGEDYIGFHTLMALSPALTLSTTLRDDFRPLPVLKVLYRNSSRIQEVGGAAQHTLRPVAPAALPAGANASEFLRKCVHDENLQAAEQALVGLAAQSPEQAFNELLPVVEEATEVHRVVLMHRAWDMLPIVGREQAAAMLRQSLRYCVKNEKSAANYFGGVRTLLPKLFDQYQLDGRALGTRVAEDAWLEGMVETLWKSTPDQAADAVAAALRDGFAPSAISEAVSLVANQLVLRDAGRTGNQVQPNKQEGSVHGDSIGVHACDSANAWRSLARQANTRNAFAATILAGYQVSLDRTNRGGKFQEWQPRPNAAQLASVKFKDKCHLLGEISSAIRSNDQELACAATQAYLDLGHAPSNLWYVFARFATSEDGALHAEKFYRTAKEEYELSRPAFRNRQLIALARVSASQFGLTAPGYLEAQKLLS